VQEAFRLYAHEVNISIGMIWINMLDGDSQQAAQAAAAGIIRDGRIHHFYDPVKRAGQAVAESLGAGNAIAWDIYLFYERDSLWNTFPPRPMQWFHQLDATWADPAHHAWDSELRRRLYETFQELKNKP
jgi:hypothetical protein